MRSPFTRAAAAAAVLVVALPATASADVDDYAAEATTTAVSISVLESAVGSPLLDLVGTDALAASDPTASASIEAVEVLGNAVGEVRMATSDGDAVRDPAEGDGCTVPTAATGLTLDALCTVAAADADTAPSEASATATAQLLDVGVNGSLLAGALTGPLTDLLTGLAGPLSDGAVNEAITVFTEACNEFLAQSPVGPAEVADLLDQTPEQLDPVRTAIANAVIGDGDPCLAIIDLSLSEITEFVIDVQPLADALDGVDLVTLSVDAAGSTVGGDDTTLSAEGEQALVAIGGPSLDFLDDVINGIVQGLYDGFGDSIEEITGQEIPGELDLTDEVAGALEQIPLFGITESLLEAEINGGAATADLTIADGTTTSGGTEPFVTVTIAPGVVELLGGDPEMATVSLSAGESQTIAEGTPAESTISVGALTTEDGVTFEDTDLTGSTARASATTVSLLTGVEGGIDVTLAESTAGVFGAMDAAPAPEPEPEPAPEPEPLPVTGGGAAAVAALALAGAVALRRRRD